MTGSGQMKRATGHMSLENFTSIVDQIYRHTMVLNLYMQGEPYLNKELPQMIAYAKSKNLFVSLSTNAQRLPELGKGGLPHHLIVSVDGATQERYVAYRKGGELSAVQEFVSVVADWKKKNKRGLPFLELQFLVHRKNETEVQATKELFKGQYDRFVTKSMQIINDENKAEFTPQASSRNRYAKDVAMGRGCYKMLSSSVITQDGQLALCCMDKNAEFVRGNMFQEGYLKLLQNEEARSYRKMLIDKKSKLAICSNCPFA
jgi:radical SAM protein with 4Fe4S-binding SPASM domain